MHASCAQISLNLYLSIEFYFLVLLLLVILIIIIWHNSYSHNNSQLQHEKKRQVIPRLKNRRNFLFLRRHSIKLFKMLKLDDVNLGMSSDKQQLKKIDHFWSFQWTFDLILPIRWEKSIASDISY